MMRQVSNIMITDFFKVDLFDSIRSIQNIALENDVDCFVVMEYNKVVGVLTHKELMTSHPNRIAADAMSTNLIYVKANVNIWEAKRIFDETNVPFLLVNKDDKVIGIISKLLLTAELGRHTDLLTGLYKSEYIYYNAANLIKNNAEFSIAFLDINNFGYIDKKYGHTNGDEILKEVALILKEKLPKDSYLCRFGGDEFTIITPCHLERCSSFINKLLNTIEDYKFHNEIPVTISAGIVGINTYEKMTGDSYSTVSSLINIASLASTKAKKDKCRLTIISDPDIYEIA